jgi:ATP-dependent Clp protease adaptor protein ClpS
VTLLLQRMVRDMADETKDDNKGTAEAGGGSATATKPKRQEKTKRPSPKHLPPYNVVLLNDDDHTFDYVIEMLAVVFGHPVETGTLLAKEVNEAGRAIVLTTHKELAELKREQIIAYGVDPRIATCRGPMGAVIEPAQG